MSPPSALPTAAVAVPVPEPDTWHFRHPVRIYWEDTDAGGIVFYGNYLKFMERARSEWLSALGLSQERLRSAGEGMFVVGETQLRYLKPARLDDLLTITVRLVELGRATIAFQQEVWRGDTVLTQGRVRIGWVEPFEDHFKPGRIPAQILALLPTPIQTPEVDRP
ncbi:MAG: tol-pal system-associated acyl-CoA thioesterase [Rubrivivax sp.]|nr:MAG: tol-pal system-associated acyl-CoA thioesterase [Rubrivivax sp.]